MAAYLLSPADWPEEHDGVIAGIIDQKKNDAVFNKYVEEGEAKS